MNKAIFQGNWNEIKGKIQREWGNLTQNDLTKIEGDSNALFGIVEKQYGYTKEEAEKKVNDFLNKMMPDKKNERENTNQPSSYWSTFTRKIKNIADSYTSAFAAKIQEEPLAAAGLLASSGMILGYLLHRKRLS